jgi:hypothetical protein
VLLAPVQPSADGIRAEIRVDAPAAAVFAHVSDLHNMETWWPEHPVYRRLHGDGGPGTHYAWIYVARGVPVPGYSRVVTREPEKLFEYRAGPPLVGIRIGYRFAAEDRATRVSFWFLSPFARARAFGEHLVPEVTRALDRLAANLAAG